MRGFVYVLKNGFLVGAGGAPLLKIGGTERSAYERARELSAATGVPGEFSIVHEVATENWQHLEALVHQRLRSFRRDGEFFEVPLATVVACIEDIQRQNSHLRALEVSFKTVTAPPVPATGVAFLNRRGGYDVYSDGVSVGALFIDSTHAMYDFHSEQEILFAEIFRLPGRGNAHSLQAVTREAQKRAAWIAPILKAFTTPRLEPEHSNGIQTVIVNGLRVAEVKQRAVVRGFLKRRRELVYDWSELPFSEQPGLAETFARRVMLAPSHLMQSPIFVVPDSKTILDSVTTQVRNSIFVSVSMSTLKWCCHVDIMNYGIVMEESAG